MAVSWTSAGYTEGTTNSGSINSLAPIPDKYVLLKGFGWGGSGATARAIFGDVYGYAERTSTTTAKVYLCQREWIYNTKTTNYATCAGISTNVVRSSTASNNYMWGYDTYATLSVTGSSTTSLNNIRYGGSSNSSSPGNPYAGALYIGTTGRSWWRQLTVIDDIPVTASANSVTLNFGAVAGTATNFEYTSSWTASLPITPMVVKVKVNGAWKDGVPYVKVSGDWKKGIAWVKVNGTWKKL